MLLTQTLAAILIGVCLGLLGSGGSSLTVPALVYLVHHDPKTAIAESLAIVALVALAAAIPRWIRREIAWRAVVFFGGTSMLGTALAARLSRHASGDVQLLAFAVVVLIAALAMLRSPSIERSSAPRAPFWLALDGLLVGAVTGFVGIGGGFLIVPALHTVARLPLHPAMATSLAIIALNAGVGFAAYRLDAANQGIMIDGRVVASFVVAGAIGTLAGARFGRRIEPKPLKRVFAIVLILIASGILLSRILH